MQEDCKSSRRKIKDKSHSLVVQCLICTMRATRDIFVHQLEPFEIQGRLRQTRTGCVVAKTDIDMRVLIFVWAH
jgi:hypothetical protein